MQLDEFIRKEKRGGRTIYAVYSHQTGKCFGRYSTHAQAAARLRQMERFRSESLELDEKKKWIQKAIKHPGALHRQLGVKAGKKIPAKKLAAAAKKGGKLGRRARLAITLKKMHSSYEPEIVVDRLIERVMEGCEVARVVAEIMEYGSQ